MPNHVVVWVIAFAGLLYAGKVLLIWSLVLSLLLVQSWFLSSQVYFVVNTLSWSLSCELVFYAAFSFLLLLVWRIAVARLWSWVGVLVAGVLLVLAVVLLMLDPVVYWFVWVFLGTRALEFVFGMVLARIVQEGRWIWIGVWLLVGLAVAVFAVVPYVLARFGYVATMVILFVLLILVAVAADLCGETILWCGARMVRLGELSFVFYLLYQVVIWGLDEALGHRLWPLCLALGVIVVMLFCSFVALWLLHYAVERLAVRLLVLHPIRHAVLDGSVLGRGHS